MPGVSDDAMKALLVVGSEARALVLDLAARETSGPAPREAFEAALFVVGAHSRTPEGTGAAVAAVVLGDRASPWAEPVLRAELAREEPFADVPFGEVLRERAAAFLEKTSKGR
jgi:hypothetical protein